jgi:hypothetical protein
MGVFKKQGVYWIDYYVNGHRKRERIGPNKRLAATVLQKRKVAIAEGKYLDTQRPITATFEEMTTAYSAYSRKNKPSWDRDERSVKRLASVFGGSGLLRSRRPTLRGTKRCDRRPLTATGGSQNLPRLTGSWPA